MGGLPFVKRDFVKPAEKFPMFRRRRAHVAEKWSYLGIDQPCGDSIDADVTFQHREVVKVFNLDIHG
jgi:hypothetical protein